jgi:TatD DNase family protein
VIDTHVQLDSESFFEGAREVWEQARAGGVEAALAVGVEPASWQRTIDTARALPGVSLALGIHPQVVPHLDDATIGRALRELPDLLEKEGARAVGEIGLDGPAGDLDRQERVMIAQLDIARQLSLPVSLHVFKIHGRALEVLRKFGKIAGGVAHSYSGSSELVRDYLSLGWSISFAGAITRSNARKPMEACRRVPLEHLVVETDAPFQPTGADARDRKRGDPQDLGHIAAAVARARGVDQGVIAEATTINARRIFRL